MKATDSTTLSKINSRQLSASKGATTNLMSSALMGFLYPLRREWDIRISLEPLASLGLLTTWACRRMTML